MYTAVFNEELNDPPPLFYYHRSQIRNDKRVIVKYVYMYKYIHEYK